MSATRTKIVIPRPGRAFPSKPPIPGPSEESFVSTFGALLPPAQYLQTQDGKAAFYSMPPSVPSVDSQTPDRVLFVHGIQTPAIGMLPLARALHDSCSSAHFVLVDLWGHGLSDTPTIPHEAAIFHRLLDALLDHLQWPSVHLIGFSFGGSLTAGYVASRPHRVSSLILIAPAGLLRISSFSEEDRHHLDRSADDDETRRVILHFLEDGQLVVPSDWRERAGMGEVVAEAVREWQMREHPGHTASVVAAFRDGGVMDNHDVFEKVAQSSIPTLVVLGEKDDICAEQELREIGFDRISVVPRVGHSVVRERGPEVAGFIIDFWNGLT
jgi:pimeloyl-ACP methyl ester carboxylesterase